MNVHAVGLRELKARLAEYVRKVRAGEVVLVTDRGRVVAELRAPTIQVSEELLAPLNDLVRDGALERGLPHDAEAYQPSGLALVEGTARAVLGWLRGEGTAPDPAERRRPEAT